MFPSQYTEVQSYSNLQRLLQAQVDMQFADLRTMLLLPIPQAGLEAGCNFATASILFNMIAGASVCFYNASETALSDRKNRGPRFKKVLEKFYPWQDESLSQDECVSILYEAARNPLAHSLGLNTPPKDLNGKQIALLKSPLSSTQINEMEEAKSKPNWLPPTIMHHQRLSYGSVEVAISVPTLYWGVHRTLHNLFGDSSQAAKADALAKVFSLQWDKITTDEGYSTETSKVQKM